MPYFAAVCGFSSTLSLTIFTFSPREPAISSSAGAIIRQGPHHSAQKSTTDGPGRLQHLGFESGVRNLANGHGKYLVVLGMQAKPRVENVEPMNAPAEP